MIYLEGRSEMEPAEEREGQLAAERRRDYLWCDKHARINQGRWFSFDTVFC